MPAEHIIKRYDEELDRLNKMIVEMGGLAESQLAAAIDAVVKRDSDLAASVVEGDGRVDQIERDLDTLAIRLLALRQPMARDLREIFVALKIASDLERICDYAANVAKRSMSLNMSPPLPQVRGLAALGALAGRQLHDVLGAYRDNDAEAAERIRARDAELDLQYTSLFRELLTYMMEDARSITPCTHLLFMAKNIERVGDHVTNIAENVWFRVRGDEVLSPRERRDATHAIRSPE